MVQYNYPTTILLGQGSLAEFVNRLKAANHKKILIVTDAMVEKLGIVKKLTDLLGPAGISYAVFTDVHPNPVEEDVEKGVAAYKAGNCDCIRLPRWRSRISRSNSPAWMPTAAGRPGWRACMLPCSWNPSSRRPSRPSSGTIRRKAIAGWHAWLISDWAGAWLMIWGWERLSRP